MAKLGSNAGGLRRYNERLVLSVIRRMNEASKTEIARATGLSPQAALRIVENLEADGRLIRAGKRTGGKGQPAIPYRINGASGMTIGVEVGRDKLACAMLDFDGRVLAYESRTSAFPTPHAALAIIHEFTRNCFASLPASQAQGFMGFGIAMPWFLGEWSEEGDPGATQVSQWPVQDLELFFRSNLDGPVMFDNDGNAAALAELHCGAGAQISDFLYIHLGHFIGGGLVLGNEVRRGHHGNAASLASMPLSFSDPGQFLLRYASANRMPSGMEKSDPEWETWYRAFVEALAFTITGANSLLDLQAVIIGGEQASDMMDDLMTDIGKALMKSAPRDFFQPRLLCGKNNARAAAMGAALLPVHSSFSPNLSALFKTRN